MFGLAQKWAAFLLGVTTGQRDLGVLSERGVVTVMLLLLLCWLPLGGCYGGVRVVVVGGSSDVVVVVFLLRYC